MNQTIYYEERVRSYCREQQDVMTSLLRRLLAIPSESDTPHERELARFIHTTLKDFGIKSTICDHEPACIATLATFGRHKDGILLSCPLDTAPVGNPQQWKFHPYLGVIDNGKMYGRGTADCKSGIVAMIYAILALKHAGVPEDKFRIELVLDGGEHNGSFSGMQHALSRHAFSVSGGIIGYAYEGDLNELAIGARGYHRYSFTTHGKTAHSGSRFRKGVNAISAMARFIEELEDIELPKARSALFDFGSRLTFSLIEGGRAINMVPDECTTKLDIRTTPEQSKADTDALILQAIERVLVSNPDFKIDTTYLNGAEGYLLQGNERIIQSVKTAMKKFTEKPPMTVVTGPAHVGNILFHHGVPVVVRGPHGDNVHAYDEWVEVATIPHCAELYTRTVLHYFDLAEPEKKEEHY